MNRLLPTSFLPVLFLLFIPAAPQTQPAPAQPATALDYFRRADDLTNIRLPGSTPFHMKVTFHAYPGIDFAAPGKSGIVTGDGTYEETWLAPDKWRREVTLGSYHAVEIRADGARKFQASQDYEPSRVLMFMRALLDPMPRYLLEPEIQDRKLAWKIEHLTAGSLPWVRISFTDYVRVEATIPCPRSYDFLPGGILIRSSDYDGLLTTWQDHVAFAGKLVPRRLAVQGDGLDGPMLTAEVAIENAPPDAVVSQMTGPPADPGTTLLAFDELDLGRPDPVHIQVPQGWTGMSHSSDPPPDLHIYTIGVIDRGGVPREVELSGVRNFGQPAPRSQEAAVGVAARSIVEAFRRDRYHPALLDGKPCEVLLYWGLWTTPVIQ